GDAFDALVADHVRDALDEGGLVDLVGQLGDDDLAAAVLGLLDLHAGLHGDAAPAGAVGVQDLLAVEDHGGGGEVRALDEAELEDLVHGGVRVVDEVGDDVAELVEVVGGDVGGHADGDAGRAVQEQVGQARGEDDGLVDGV